MSKITLLVALCVFTVSAHHPRCFLPFKQGTSCKIYPPSQKYHYDPYLNQCHAFQHKGCGGTVNQYTTLKDCEDTCVKDPRAYIKCPLHARPIFDSKNNTLCPVYSKYGEGCENEDAICTHFETISLCCNRTVFVGYRSDKYSLCTSGKTRWHIDGSPVLAKSCEAIVCPTGYTCRNGYFFSSCCED